MMRWITTVTTTTAHAAMTFAVMILIFLGEQHRTKRFNGRFNHLKASNITCNGKEQGWTGGGARACVRAGLVASATRERTRGGEGRGEREVYT